MQMRPAVQIQSVIKAMTDVVLPAVDPSNKLAQEQARLVIGMLNLLARQLPMQYRFDLDELARLIEFAGALREQARGGAETAASLSALATVAAGAGRTIERAGAGPDDVEQAVRGLRAASGAVVTAMYRDGDDAARRSVEKSVLAMSKEQLLRDRSWVLSQGWEPDPKAVPAIGDLLGR